MAKIAVIKTGGKQYKVKEGETIKIEKIEGENGKKLSFDTLLIASEDAKEFNLGKPSLGEKVNGEIVDQGVHDKVTVVKYKNKTRYKKTQGHKQLFTAVKISSIA